MLIWANGKQRPGAIRRLASNIEFLEFSQRYDTGKWRANGFFSGVGSVYLGRTFTFRFGCIMGQRYTP